MSYIDSLYCILKTLEISVPTVLDATTGRMTPDRADMRLASWSKALVARAGIELSVHGRERVDWSRSYVVMSNHQSMLDIPVLYQALPLRLRMVAKQELFQVPIWGRAMRDAGMINVDRKNRTQAVQSLRAAAEVIRSGVSVWIAPEGTRSRTGHLGPLKKGGFHLAKDTATAILPVAIRGTRDLLPAQSKRLVPGGPVDVTVGAAIPVEGRDTASLMAAVKAFFADQQLT